MLKYLKHLCLLALIFVQANAWAQTSEGIVGGFNIENFPEVSFIYRDRSPVALTRNDFQNLMESGEIRDFTFEAFPGEQQASQHILILWENMAYHGVNKFNFTRDVLDGFFSDVTIPAGTQFSIATFNRRRNDPATLTNLTNGFTADRAQILNAIRNHRLSTVRFPSNEYPRRSDAYTAIREGIDVLQPFDGTTAIIIFTAGRPMTPYSGGMDEPSQVLLHAQRFHTPVYVFQFYRDTGVATHMEGFARGTLGDFFSYQRADDALRGLRTLFPQINERYRGHNYRITFISSARRGSESRTVSIRVGGTEITEQLFPPPFSLSLWINENLWLFIGLIVLLVALIVLIIILLVRYKRKRDAAIQANLENVRQEADAKTTAARQEAERVRQQQLAYQQQQEQQKRDAEAQAENERLVRLMQTKNLFPRLQCKVGNENFTHSINKTTTTIGRKGYGNDVEFNSDKVSRNHAEIVFTGGGFEIIDRKSTNKVIINGQFFERATLKNGDIIGLGEVVITFYV